MGISCTVSEITGDFAEKKSPNFLTALVICDPAEGVSLGIGYHCCGPKN